MIVSCWMIDGRSFSWTLLLLVPVINGMSFSSALLLPVVVIERLDESRLRVKQRQFARQSSDIAPSCMEHDEDMVVPKAL